MPIKVACRCGQSFAAPDNLAGKTVKCPKCSGPLAVPNPAAMAAPAVNTLDDLFDEAGLVAGLRCPKCDTQSPPNAVLCVKCGFNFQTGEKVASTAKAARSSGHGEAAESIMARAAVELEKAAEQPKEESKGSMALNIIMAVVLLVIAVSVIGIAYVGFNKIEKSGNSQYYAGVVMAAVGGMMLTAGFLALARLNAKDGALHLVLSLLIPFYGAIYGALRNHGFWALLYILGATFLGGGIAMQVYFAGASDEEPKAQAPVIRPADSALTQWHHEAILPARSAV